MGYERLKSRAAMLCAIGCAYLCYPIYILDV
jgi:hypothetical protein